MSKTAFALSAADRSFVLAVIRRVLPAEHEAHDATQDALLAAFRHYDSFRGDSAFRTWLYRIAVTTALGYLRRHRRSREDLAASADGDLMPAQLVDPAPLPDELTAVRELAERVEDALPALTAAHREVLELRIADHTEPEIAARLGITLANVKIRTFRGRAQLREALAA